MRESERAALARLIRFGGQQLASDLAAIYLVEMPSRIAKAHTALQMNDAATLDCQARWNTASGAAASRTALHMSPSSGSSARNSSAAWSAIPSSRRRQ